MTSFYSGKIEVLSPIAHNSDESLGTETKFRRIQIVSDGKIIRIPVYSGNAFRGILRRIAARQFCDSIGLGKESMSDKLYYTFFTGGSLTKGAAQNYIEVGAKRELREHIPFLSLFGSALHNQIIAGKLQIGMGIPIAKETESMTREKSDISIWELLDEIFYTRRNDLEDPKESKKEDPQAQQMKYTIETMIAGTMLKHDIATQNCNEIELSCLGAAMEKMLENGILGGKSATGHGRIKANYTPVFESGDKYFEYIKNNKDKIYDYVKGMENIK